LEAGVKALLDLSTDELQLELGKRLVDTRRELDSDKDLMAVRATGQTIDRQALQSVGDFARGAAERFLKKFNKQMYSLVCDAGDPDHAAIRSAATQGAEALGYVISGALVVSFGWLPGIATVIAVIIAKRVANSSYEAFCEEWKERL